MTASASQMLLKGGSLLIHDENGHVTARNADLLVEGDQIKQIDDDIRPSEGTHVLDCSDCIISPGFINTHVHLWQTQQKGLHANQIMADYYHSGNMASSHYEPDDVFWGVLGSALESLDGGTTTVVDHAHANYSADHSKENIRATIASGIRSIFCYCVHQRVAAWKPELKTEDELFPGWVMDTYQQLADIQPFGPNGRVQLGFAMDAMFVKQPVLKETLLNVRKFGAHLITSHATSVSMMDTLPSVVTIMHEAGVLGPDILLSHANKTTPDELRLINDFGAHVSSTPLSELQMGHGTPVCLEPGFQKLSSIGTDSNSICTSYMPDQMSIVLQTTRARRTDEQMRNGTWDATIGPTVEDVFNLGTIIGARAIKMDHKIGSLAVGKKADIVVFQGTRPGMAVVSRHNPVAAVVLHSSAADIKTVIVDGVIRKNDFAISKIAVPHSIECRKNDKIDTKETLEWSHVEKALECSRQRLDKLRREKVDEEAARDGLVRSFLEMLSLHSTGSTVK